MATFKVEPRYEWQYRLIEIMVVVTLITLVIVIVYPVYARARARARDAVCMTNLRQLATAVGLYIADHDGTYPRSRSATEEDTWTNYDGDGQISSLELLLTQFKPPELYANPRHFAKELRCPADPQAKRSREASYSTNGWFDVFTVRDSQIHRPTQSIYLAERRRGVNVDYYTWWLFQSDEWPPDPQRVPLKRAAAELDIDRHQGYSYYLYCDGHIELKRFQDTWKPEVQHWSTHF